MNIKFLLGLSLIAAPMLAGADNSQQPPDPNHAKIKERWTAGKSCTAKSAAAPIEDTPKYKAALTVMKDRVDKPGFDRQNAINEDDELRAASEVVYEHMVNHLERAYCAHSQVDKCVNRLNKMRSDLANLEREYAQESADKNIKNSENKVLKGQKCLNFEKQGHCDKNIDRVVKEVEVLNKQLQDKGGAGDYLKEAAPLDENNRGVKIHNQFGVLLDAMESDDKEINKVAAPHACPPPPVAQPR